MVFKKLMLQIALKRKWVGKIKKAKYKFFLKKVKNKVYKVKKIEYL